METINIILFLIAAWLVWKLFANKKDAFTVKSKKEADLYCYPLMRDRDGTIYYNCQFNDHIRPAEHQLIPRSSPTPEGVNSIMQDFW